MEIVNQKAKYKPGFIPWLAIRASIFITLYVPFSDWAINADSLGKYDLGLSIFFAFTFTVALYGSIVFSFVALILSIVYNVSNKKGDDLLLYAFFISISPIPYIILLDLI
mgnify:CR=1 FL=1